jgi:hypothetical protein
MLEQVPARPDGSRRLDTESGRQALIERGLHWRHERESFVDEQRRLINLDLEGRYDPEAARFGDYDR